MVVGRFPWRGCITVIGFGRFSLACAVFNGLIGVIVLGIYATGRWCRTLSGPRAIDRPGQNSTRAAGSADHERNK